MASRTVNALPDVIIGILDNVSIPANASSTYIDAPEISGYKFLCWITFPTIGWIGFIYSPTPNETHAQVFTNAGTSTSARNFRGYGLYKRTI